MKIVIQNVEPCCKAHCLAHLFGPITRINCLVWTNPCACQIGDEGDRRRLAWNSGDQCGQLRHDWLDELRVIRKGNLKTSIPDPVFIQALLKLFNLVRWSGNYATGPAINRSDRETACDERARLSFGCRDCGHCARRQSLHQAAAADDEV